MSVQSEIDRIRANVADSYAAVADMGGDFSGVQNSANLPGAIRSIRTASSPELPVGAVIIWSGALNDIPDGWALCDGTNGTPDLRDKFVLGAGTRGVGETGGAEEVTLTAQQMPKHTHYLSGGGVAQEGGPYVMTAKSDEFGSLVTTESTGSSKAHTNMPPYYVLCYIMKVAAVIAEDTKTTS